MLKQLKAYKEFIAILVFFAGGILWIYGIFVTQEQLETTQKQIKAAQIVLENQLKITKNAMQDQLEKTQRALQDQLIKTECVLEINVERLREQLNIKTYQDDLVYLDDQISILQQAINSGSINATDAKLLNRRQREKQLQNRSLMSSEQRFDDLLLNLRTGVCLQRQD